MWIMEQLAEFTDLTPVSIVFNLLDVLLVWYVLYKILTLIKGTKAVQLLKGIFVIIIAKIATTAFGLDTLDWLLEEVINWGFLAIIIIFQPEIRRALEQLGRGKLFQRTTNQQDEEQSRLIEAMKKYYEFDNSIVCLAHNVKYVIDADYSRNSYYTSQPLFQMLDGSIKVYANFDNFNSDDPRFLCDLEDEGGWDK